MATLTLDLIKHNEPTPADITTPQIITGFRNVTGLQAAWILCLSSLPLDLDFQIKCKMYFYLKRGLWTTEKQSSSFSP